jgi:hypothetical protein
MRTGGRLCWPRLQPGDGRLAFLRLSAAQPIPLLKSSSEAAPPVMQVPEDEDARVRCWCMNVLGGATPWSNCSGIAEWRGLPEWNDLTLSLTNN